MDSYRKVEYLECECGGEILCVYKFDDDDDVCLGMFEHTVHQRYSTLPNFSRIKNTFKAIWYILKHGRANLDCIILSKKDTKRLIETLQGFVQNQPTEKEKQNLLLG